MTPPIAEETEQVAREIVDAGFRVHATLGPGLLESAYLHCLAHELTSRGLAVQSQVPMPVRYQDSAIRILNWRPATASICWSINPSSSKSRPSRTCFRSMNRNC